MKTIIVPVDFSKYAYNGFLFALELAKIFNYKVKVVHVYGGELNAMEQLAMQAGDTPFHYLMSKLNNFVNATGQHDSVMTKVEVNTEIVDGKVVKKLVEISENPETAMIIAGTEGEYTWIEQISGSITSVLAQKAKCPVLLVPAGTEYKPFEHILYASDFASSDETMLNKIIDLANIFRASVHFIHVEDEEDVDFSEVEDNIFNRLFKDGDPSFSFNMASIKGVDVINGLNQYADENNIDMIVLVNRHRGFIDNLLGLSMTRQMAMHTGYPLMVYHFKEEEL